MDFANVRQIKDLWVSYGKIPFLGNAKFGHTKEPISLEGFMSNATRLALEERLTWAAGYFLITGSFSNVSNATDYLSNAYGSAASLRVNGLPRYGAR